MSSLKTPFDHDATLTLEVLELVFGSNTETETGVKNSLMSHKDELLEKLRSMKGNYPMTDEALRWYQGFHCTENSRIFHMYDHFPSFDNGWDSAIDRMIIHVKNMPDF